MSQKSKVLLAFTGIFVAGAVAGSVVALRVGVAKLEQVRTEQGKAPVAVVTPDQFTVRQMQQFTRELSLSEAQTKSIEPIINSASEKLDLLRQENATATTNIVKAMDDEIAVVLTAEQRQSLAKLRTQWQSRVDDRFKPGAFGNRRGGPGGQPGTTFGSGTNRQGGTPGGPRPGGMPNNRRSGPGTTTTSAPATGMPPAPPASQ